MNRRFHRINYVGSLLVLQSGFPLIDGQLFLCWHPAMHVFDSAAVGIVAFGFRLVVFDS